MIRRSRLFRTTATAGAVLTVVSTASLAAGMTSQAATPAKHPAYCSHTVKKTIISLLAGSHDVLAYGLGYKIELANGSQKQSDRCLLPKADSKSEYLHVRYRSGKTKNLGPMPAYFLGDAASMIGKTLFGVAANISASNAPRARMYWWNLATGHHGDTVVPKGFSYEGGGPNGFVLLRKGTVYNQTVQGKRTVLGKPDLGDNVGVTTSKPGLVALGDDRAKYMSFTKPGVFRDLQISGPQMMCPTLSSTTLGCYNVADDDSGLSAQQSEIVRLDGSAPTIDETGGGLPPALAGRTLVYVNNVRVRSFSANKPTVERGPKSLGHSIDYMNLSGSDPYADLHREWLPVVSAYGRVAEVNVARSHVVLLKDAAHHSTLFAVPKHDH